MKKSFPLHHLSKSCLSALLRNFCPNGQTFACCPLRTPSETPSAFRRLSLLSRSLHGRCVFREPTKGEPFVGRGATEHILPDAQNFVRLKYVSVGTSGRGRGLIFLSSKVLVLFWQNASVLLVLNKSILARQPTRILSGCLLSPQGGASIKRIFDDFLGDSSAGSE